MCNKPLVLISVFVTYPFCMFKIARMNLYLRVPCMKPLKRNLQWHVVLIFLTGISLIDMPSPVSHSELISEDPVSLNYAL